MTTPLWQVAMDGYKASWLKNHPCLNNEDWKAAAAAVREAVLQEMADARCQAVEIQTAKAGLPPEQMRGLPLFDALEVRL